MKYRPKENTPSIILEVFGSELELRPESEHLPRQKRAVNEHGVVVVITDRILERYYQEDKI